MTKANIHDENAHFIAFKNGNEAALSYFLDLYFAGYCIYAEKNVGVKSAAEDIVEEAFIKLWKKRSHIVSLAAMKSFLYVVIRNACINHIKKHAKDKYHSSHFAYLQSNADDHLEVIRAEVLSAIYHAIETLPDKCQQIFKMSYIEGQMNEQIATSLNLSVQTVKNQKVRGLKILQLYFQDKKDLLHLSMAGIVLLH
jgi:RNA polymerase sigma-70 factor (family 1)